MTVELLDIETGEVIDAMTPDEAERISHRITLKLGTLADTYEAVMPMLRDVIIRQAHLALGYPSVGAYISDRFGDALSRLDAEMRRSIARELSEAGLSVRAIAPVLGVGKSTVDRDLSGVPDGTPELPKSSTVTGLDGKVYPRPAPPAPAPAPAEPAQPRRRPLADGFRDASLDLAKIVTRFEKLVSDDRFTRNKDEVARYANDLIRARDAFQRVIDQLS